MALSRSSNLKLLSHSALIPADREETSYRELRNAMYVIDRQIIQRQPLPVSQTSSHRFSRRNMATAAQKKIVVCGGNGFLGMCFLISNSYVYGVVEAEVESCTRLPDM